MRSWRTLIPITPRFAQQAAVVHLPKTGQAVWALTRYEPIRKALADTRVFSSKSVAFNDQLNAGLANTVFGSDPPDHRRLRTATMEHLSPPGAARARG